MLTDAEQEREWLRCRGSMPYFVDRYCQIYDATGGAWVPFRLWQEQYHTLRTMVENRLVVILKARQEGLSWLVLGFGLGLMLFQPAATVLIFSKRDDEAVYLLDERLKGMYRRLPEWMQARRMTADSAHEFGLSNGSIARAFPTTGGDSYTATLAIVDEADLVPDLGALMRAVKPTIDGGGRMVLVSRADKSRPRSEFKRIYRSAKAGLTEWAAVFLPWWVRPERDEAWYEAQKADVLHRTGSLDDLHEQYPATDEEALAPRSLDKRIAAGWINQCFAREALTPGPSPVQITGEGSSSPPAIPGLRVYRGPVVGRRYVVGCDPAEGNPTSDDSAIEVLDWDSGEECATLAGQYEPAVIAAHAARLAEWYNRAAIMVERNNHGHATILWLQENSYLRRLLGYDGKEGWLNNVKGKALMYDHAADAFRDGECIVHDEETYVQLLGVEGSTLRAPEGERDDRAVAFALANVGRLGGVVEGQLFW